jgi:hypothetical protein
MRILRAVMLGHIPVVTHKFYDHEIEDLAITFDGSRKGAASLWTGATLGRETLVQQHIEAVGRYNEIAQKRNGEIDQALVSIGAMA